MGLNNHYYKRERMAKDAKVAVKKQYHKTQPVRLYQKGVFTSFRRTRTHQWKNQALVVIQNCKDKASAKWYMGKRVAYIYKVKNNSNITGCAIGANVRVMLYPNKTV